MATIKDIAIEVGVAPNTVSRALRGLEIGARADARKRAEHIRQVAARLGYRPNVAARTTRNGRFGNITMLLPLTGWNVWFPKPLVVGAMRELAQHQLNLQIAEIAPAEASRQGRMPRVLTELSSDGLIMLSAESFPYEAFDQIEIDHLPVIWANHNGSFDCAYPDEQAGMSLLTEQVLASGHRRVVLVQQELASNTGQNSTPEHFSVQARSSGYLAAMKAAGLPPHAISKIPTGRTEDSEASERTRQQIIRYLLTGVDRPTAIISDRCHLAQQILFAATELGLSVPRDLSLAAIDSDSVKQVGKRLTSLKVSWRAIGLTAARMLMQKIQSGGDALVSTPVPFTVWDGQTLAPPGMGSGSSCS